MCIIGLCPYSTTDSEEKQQCVALDNENDLVGVEKWQVYQLHETWPSPIRQLLSDEHLKVLF